ncbi:MAG: hypothetical protein AAGA86_11275 [Bacteroidota bacterium]
MKKNQKTYVLLAAVLGIWGLIGFKLVKAANPEPADGPDMNARETFVPKPLKEKDTFSILANYRDPFLGTISGPKPKRKTRPKPIQKKAPPKQIRYTGFVANEEASPEVFFVTIEGKQHMMTLNAVSDSVKLIQGSKQQVKVRCRGTTRTITLSQ